MSTEKLKFSKKQNQEVTTLEAKTAEKLESAAAISIKLAGLRLKRIDTDSLNNPEIYKEYQEIITLVENAATTFNMLGKNKDSIKHWKIAANMHLKLLMEGIRDTEYSEINLKQRVADATNAIKAAKKASDTELLATISHAVRGILKLYNHSIDSANSDIEQLLADSLKKAQR
ncbi:MAG: hypothetical protein KGH65_02015 [Candidatus Micrarchaeota archaeon]|nr:hypothetical protein [Candidatus Micrarchaeota archaeon]